MRRRWEYANLILRRDPGGNAITGWLGFPDLKKSRELGSVKSPLVILNGLGADGWQLIGQPSYEHAVLRTRQGPDRAWWVEARYLFMREVTE
jgi:hypothetical protein